MLLYSCGPSNDVRAPEVASSVSDCGVRGRAILTDSGIGLLRPGADLDTLQQQCRVVRDEVELDDEALEQRAVWFAVAGDTVKAVLDGNLIYRLEIFTPTPRTTDSLGVGSTLAALRNGTTAQALWGEGLAYVILQSHCGLSFRMEVIEALGDRPELLENLDSLPQQARVTDVLVVPCRNAPA